MADSLFLMQRYWGSDDSDVDDDDKESSTKLEEILKYAKRKRNHLHNRSVDGVVGTVPSNDGSEPIIMDCVPQPKKKKKSHKTATGSEAAQDTIIYSDSDAREVHKLPSENSVVQDTEVSSTTAPKYKKRRKSLKLKDVENGLSEDTYPKPVDPETELDPENLQSNTLKSKNSELFPVIKDVLNKEEIVVPRSLPDWLENPTVIKVDVNSKKKSVLEMEFLDDETKNSLTKSGIQHLFPVQVKVIPWLLQTNSKRLFVRPSDLCVSAPTGSGKTLAFVIPIVQSLRKKVTCEVRALVVLPVKELAVQVFKVFESFCKGTGLNAALVVGMKSFQQEQNHLIRKCSRGLLCQADIVVATPGRIIDHINQTIGFSLKYLRYLVIDEADRMMDEIQKGWLKNIESAIYKDKAIPDCCFSIENQFQKCSLGTTSACSLSHVSEPVQKLFYSATLSQDPEKLHELSLYRPKLFTSTVKQSSSETAKPVKEFVGKYTTPKSLIEKYVTCDTSVKPLIICHLLRTEKFQKVLCFTQSLEHSHRLHLVLNEMLDNTVIRELSSNLRVFQRKIILQQFAAGKVNVLVCSDLIARGIDIEDVDCVINYDAPHFMKTYIHRIGRTARAGKNGTAITLMEREEISKFRQMLRSGGKAFPAELQIESSMLAPLEKPFKAALASAAKTIATENQELALCKKGVQKSSTNKKAMVSPGVEINGHL